ncbi:MAG: hypothetical protein N2321_01235 [Melioribacteraceae bacterium]|nr:hypothetical protein [Melioribacteraceae bacterium]
MKNLFFFISFFLVTILFAQENKVVESEFKVFGNCGMCKTRIENSLKIKEVKFARWDKNSKILKVAYLSDKITLDSLMHRVAIVGHDNEKYKADDAVYSKLPKCCLYRDNPQTH